MVNKMFIISIILLTFGIIYIITFMLPFRLSKSKKEIIKEYGISHLTSENAVDSIILSSTIKASNSNFSYFFVNKSLSYSELKQNNLLKKTKRINITNLTEQQLSNLSVRNYDNALLFKGDFRFDSQNTIEVVPVENIQKTKINTVKIKLFIGLISFVIILVMFINLISHFR